VGNEEHGIERFEIMFPHDEIMFPHDQAKAVTRLMKEASFAGVNKEPGETCRCHPVTTGWSLVELVEFVNRRLRIRRMALFYTPYGER
jgi:hypothetical protein